jgi:hypothetical protein
MAINILGSNRESLFELTEQTFKTMLQEHVLITDPRRTRPHWFDGRFLAARDLANEQNYFLVRQADLGRAGGSGVIEGLMVKEVTDEKTHASKLRIDTGYGFTDTGEMVVVTNQLDIDPANIPEMQRLDAAFGLQQIPNEPGRSRTGLYIIALRPVEWTANQISAYPTSLTGDRTVQDSDVIEGVVVSLIPYADNGNDDWNRRRARISRDIFLNGRDRGMASGTLPLGIVALRSNQIVWLDPYLARRDAGAERPAGMDFGFGQRALREAQLLQYEHHLADVMNTLSNKGFEATAFFDCLPPVGRLPAQAVDAGKLSHQFFPPAMTVEFAFVPEDELPALIEESLLLPPVDLEAPAETLAGLGVMILAPMKKDDFVKQFTKLAGRTIKLTAPVGELKGNTRALEFSINYQRETGLADQTPDDSVLQTGNDWTNLIIEAQKNQLFWYVRRRHLPSAANIAGAAVDVINPEYSDVYDLYNLLKENPDLRDLWERVQGRNDIPEKDIFLKRFADRRMLEQPEIMKSMLTEAAREDATPEEVILALAPVVNPDLGKGLSYIAGAKPAVSKSLMRDAVVKTGTLIEVDRLVREVPEDKRDEMINSLKDAAKTPATFTDSLTKLRTKYRG